MRRVKFLTPGETEVLVEILKLTTLLPRPLLSYSRALGELRGDEPHHPPSRLSSGVVQTRTIQASKG